MIATPELIDAAPRTGVKNNHDPLEKQPPAEKIYLTGRPTLHQFLSFVKREGAGPYEKGALIAEWQAANEHLQSLKTQEAGLADHPPVGKLGPEYEPLLIEFLRDPLVRHGFNAVPTEVGLVELDRLVVYQKHIDLNYVRQLQEKIGAAPDRDTIFRICLPYEHPFPPVKWSRLRGNRFVFVSPSNDLRFLGTMPLQSRHITGYPPPGAVVGVVGVTVGFGSNFLNAVRAQNRIILNNGSHRAYTLRSLGITHVPCIIQHVSSRAELDVVAASAVRREPACFLEDPRPSVLKDYFDPKLHKVVQVHPRLRQVTVKFEVDEAYIPAL